MLRHKWRYAVSLGAFGFIRPHPDAAALYVTMLLVQSSCA